jgi:hypothetical protein
LVPISLLARGLTPVLTSARRLAIDATKSSLIICVFKSGLFSGLAHDHTIQAPVATGNIDLRGESVSLTFNLADMKVLDPGVRDSGRNDIDATMKAPKVLDGDAVPDHQFRLKFSENLRRPQRGHGRAQAAQCIATNHGALWPGKMESTRDRYR